MLKQNHKTHDETIEKLKRRKQLAEWKLEERQLKSEIFRLWLPFHFKPKFNKTIVALSIAAVTAYTVAAVLLQKYTMMELSPTLTTCVYAFFGTELIGLAGIKICDARPTQGEPCNTSENGTEGGPDAAG